MRFDVKQTNEQVSRADSGYIISILSRKEPLVPFKPRNFAPHRSTEESFVIFEFGRSSAYYLAQPRLCDIRLDVISRGLVSLANCLLTLIWSIRIQHKWKQQYRGKGSTRLHTSYPIHPSRERILTKRIFFVLQVGREIPR